MEALTLYHGTDGRLVAMSQKEREKYLAPQHPNSGLGKTDKNHLNILGKADK